MALVLCSHTANKKKKRCSGERPFCRNCVAIGNHLGCVYERSLASGTNLPLRHSPDPLQLIYPDLLMRLYVSLFLLDIWVDLTSLIFRRAEFLSHGGYCCVRMIPEKLDAIACGDLTGRIVHPIFIHLAHILGCVYYRDDNDQRAPPDLEATYYQLVMRCLEERDSFTPVENLQAYILLGIYRYLVNQFGAAWDCGTKVYDIIFNADMHITLPSADYTGSFPRHSVSPGRYGHIQAIDEDDEKRSALCFSMHSDFSAILIWSRPLVLPHHLDDDFRNLIVRGISLSSCYSPQF